MKLPISWLKDYVDFDDTVEGLADKLTFSGVEVEGIETIGGGLDGVVVGEVRSVEKHPDADKLTVCKVFDGSKEHEVVCGAPNVREGMKSAFAPTGTTLPNGMKLKKAKIRGVTSHGMLCAEDELGLSDSHEGITDLDTALEPGTPFSDVVGPPEVVMDLEITPNRPDCLSVIGLAREVATLYGSELKVPTTDLKHSHKKVEELAKVTLEDAEGCPRYTAQVLDGIEIGPAPDWMQRRLAHAGIRPINNVVDITNYVLLETGHPLHAFDQSLLDDNHVIIRKAKKGETMTTLDEIERKLETDMVVISDPKRAVAIGGVMGGAGSEINDSTQSVLLESAYFEPSSIRSTSRRLGLSTESSYRFERGVNVTTVDWASQRAASLMVEFANASVAQGLLDEYPAPPETHSVSCRYDRLRMLTGMDAKVEDIHRIFESLELKVTASDHASCTVEVPSFRGDIRIEVDLIEEFARMYGLDKIPTPHPHATLAPGANDRHYQAAQACRENLAGLGLQETGNYSLVSQQLLDRFEGANTKHRVVMPYPLSQDQTTLRTSLVPQMVETLGRNNAHQVADVAFFEVGRVYRKGKKGAVDEKWSVCIGITGAVGRTGLQANQPVSDEECFFWLKGIWQNLVAAQGFDATTTKDTDIPYFEEGFALSLQLDSTNVGTMGLVKNELRKEWRLTGPVGVLEVDLEPLLKHFGAVRPLAEVAAYPSIERDMALVVAQSVKHDDIMSVIKAAAPDELEQIELFDIFEGESIGTGKKSMAYSLTYRSPAQTLTDEEANRYHDRVKAALKEQLGVDIREG